MLPLMPQQLREQFSLVLGWLVSWGHLSMGQILTIKTLKIFQTKIRKFNPGPGVTPAPSLLQPPAERCALAANGQT